MGVDPERVREALAEQAEGAFVSVTRADGSSALVSRAVAEWLVSSAPAPNESDVGVALRDAMRVRVVDRMSIWGDAPTSTASEIVHADVSDPAAIEELHAALRIQDTRAHLLMAASAALEITGPEGLRACIGLLYDMSLLRWQGHPAGVHVRGSGGTSALIAKNATAEATSSAGWPSAM
jgi:hypothetical protein